MIDDLKGDESWRMFRIISEFTEGFDKLSNLGFGVSIFGSARTKETDPDYARARELARRLGEDGFYVVTGGGPGIMEAANRGAAEAGAVSIGLNIELPHEQNKNPYQNLSVDFRYFFARKVMFVKHSMSYVCMPGGFGTLDEFFESLTLMQTNKIYPMPLVLMGCDYWRDLYRWVSGTMLKEGKITEKDLALVTLTDDVEEVLDIIRRHREWKRSKIEEATTS